MTLKLLLRNSFESGTVGVTINPGNSGDSSNDAFNAINVTGTGTATYSTTNPAQLDGTKSLRVQTPATTDVVRLDYNGMNDGSGSARSKFTLNSLPGALTFICRFTDGAAATICTVAISSANKIQLLDKVGSVLKTFTNTLAISTSYRVEAYVLVGTTTGNGTIQISYFLGNSTSPAETTFVSTGANAGTLPIAECRFVKATGAGTFDGWVDEVAYLPGAGALVGPPGPITVPAPRAARLRTFILPQTNGQITLTGTGSARVVRRMLAPTVTGVSTPDFVVTPEPDNLPPRVRLEINNAGGSTLYVTRTAPDGFVIPVRGGDPVSTLSGPIVVLYDYEMPYNQAVTYQAGALTAGPVTLDVMGPWLIHPGIPSLSKPILVRLLADATMASSAGVHDIISRRNAIIISDGRRKGLTFQMVLKTVTKEERSGLEQLFYDTSTLLLQITYPWTDEYEYRWIFVGNVSVGRVSPDDYNNPIRFWTCDCTEVDLPVGSLQAQRTFADLLAECPTFADVKNRYRTFRGVLTGIVGT